MSFETCYTGWLAARSFYECPSCFKLLKQSEIIEVGSRGYCEPCAEAYEAAVEANCYGGLEP